MKISLIIDGQRKRTLERLRRYLQLRLNKKLSLDDAAQAALCAMLDAMEETDDSTTEDGSRAGMEIHTEGDILG